MANPTIPVQETVTAFVLRVSQAYQYRDGKRTDQRVVDAQGRPVTRITAFGRLFGSVTEFQIEVPDPLAEQAQLGDVIAPFGQIHAELRGGDYGSINSKLVGVEQLIPVSTADQVFDSLAKTAQK